MKGLFSRLFGGGTAASASPAAAVEHEGYRIRPEPFAASGQFQTAGTIEKDFPDGPKQHRFVRAERHESLEAAMEFSIAKGRQIIDQVGERIFDARS